MFPILYDLAKIAEWIPYTPQHLAHVSRVVVLYSRGDPALPLATAGEELNELQIDELQIDR